MVSTYPVAMVAYLGLVLFGLPPAIAQAPRNATKQLVEYIQNAKKLGLKDTQIRQNALAGGWDKGLVDEAFIVVKYVGTTALPPAEASKGATPSTTAKAPEDYRIGAGDVLQVAVWKEPDASVPDALVRADGKITLPLIKDVEVIGLSPAELEKVLTERFSKFVKSPDITVIPKQITSLKVYLVGGLKKEGPLPILAQMRVLQAINEAGGLTDYAKRKKIYILRNEDGKQVRLPFDYDAVIKGERIEQNILLQADDMIIVPQ